MSFYHWMLIAGIGIFCISFLAIFFNTVIKSWGNDPTPGNANLFPAIKYSFIGAMAPQNKESAFLHLPIYIAGIFFHIGTFLSLFLIIILFFNMQITDWIVIASSVLLLVSGMCGLGILIKRISKQKLRSLSVPDDYFSNILVTGFQVITAITLFWEIENSILFIYVTVLLIYIPIGKLRHTIYFFTSRIHLGRYYGKRSVWPILK